MTAWLLLFCQVHLAHTAIKAEQQESGKLTRAMSVSVMAWAAIFSQSILAEPCFADKRLRRRTEQWLWDA
jgi:hypothetical protein